jgi:hypothetical protein
MKDSNYPSRAELASKEDYEKAKSRGIASGCEGAFLSQFIETELRLMQKWSEKRKSGYAIFFPADGSA